MSTESKICVVCKTRECNNSRHLPFCGPSCVDCNGRIISFQRIIDSKRNLIKTAPLDAVKKIEKNIRKLERKIERMTTVD